MMLVITAIIVWIIDLTPIEEDLEVMIAKWLRVKKVRIPKPFSCSLCMTWWTLIVMLLVTGHMSLITIGLSALCAFLTKTIYFFLIFCQDFLEKLISLLYWLMGER